MDYLKDIGELYSNILEEGIEEKIPKLLNLVNPSVENKENYIRWAATTFDPSKNSDYITWILRMLKKGVIVGEEDGQKVKERLSKFDELKRKPNFPTNKRDINSYKTYGDLAETLDEFQGIKTKGEIKRESQEEGIQFINSLGGPEGVGTSLYIVTTDEAGAKHFRNTDWCVKDPRFFNDYGPPYYFFTKEGKPKTLLHLNSNQCMDVRDRPTNLDNKEKDLMESEEMTDYVLANDNSDSALAFYSEKVGDGYDGKISSIFIEKLDKLTTDANSKLEMFSISETYVEELEYYEPTAWGSIPYDMSPYKDHIEDKEFLNAVRRVLDKFDIYPSDDWEYGTPISEDLDAINIDIRYDYEGSYGRESVIDRLESFIKELESIERRFDPEEFDEQMQEKMMEYGYLSSGWASFKNKVSINDLQFDHFIKSSGLKYVSDDIKFIESNFDYAQDFRIVDVSQLLQKYKRQDHPYVLLAEFVRPFVDRGLEFKIERGAGSMRIFYQPKYEENKSGKQYIKGLKAAKDFDTHFDFYVDQIKKFMEKYVFPFLRNFQENKESYDIPENIKLPLIQLKGRKESPDQQMLDLHEKKTFYNFFKLFLERSEEE